MQNEWIVISEYCDKCHIEPTFIDMLCESGLIDVEQEGGERYLPFSELPDVERYSRMYYDLSINMEGIDAIHHLLARMEEMQREIHSLRGRLRLHGSINFPFVSLRTFVLLRRGKQEEVFQKKQAGTGVAKLRCPLYLPCPSNAFICGSFPALLP